MIEYTLGVFSGIILAVAVPAVYRWGQRVWARRHELTID